MSLIEEPIITPQTESGVSRVNAEAFVFDFAIHINSLQKLDASLLSESDMKQAIETTLDLLEEHVVEMEWDRHELASISVSVLTTTQVATNPASLILLWLMKNVPDIFTAERICDVTVARACANIDDQVMDSH